MKIIAHRGDSANHPENTPEGWAAAFSNGAFAIEADVRLSSDGACVCAHDRDLMRLFDRPERPEDLTADELLGLASTSGARIVALADVLQHAAADRHVLLDIKDETLPALEAIWTAIAATVPQAHRHQVIAGCHTLEAVRFFVEKGQTGILGFIPGQERAEAFFETGAKIVRLWERDVSAERVKQLQQCGAEVWVTAGGTGTPFGGGETSPEHLEHLLQAGADGVLVDDVAMARSVVEAAR
ncbi:MAG TPA: glycerophosphodiester phosphodiesterase family protein [Devosia sp.]|jgi:glycerophosphoryl diester phosphodiesterase|uniref:glycerophosphodiester phosphodiesterase n=1 Tax=Devosia sp. TaxID=1871048 RepID=UPI002F9374B8